MTRRDIIIIAVLANIGVLALLFMLAFKTEDEKVAEHPEIAYNITQETPASTSSQQEVDILKSEPSDDLDAVIDDATGLNSASHHDDDNIQFSEADPTPAPSTVPVPTPTPETPPGTLPDEHPVKTVEVTVKKGDFLEKIAKANGTSIDAIMKINNLKNDRLKIGQVLQVPVGTKSTKVASIPKTNTPKAPVASADTQYYVVKAGDNPWKIAKQFHIKVDDLLKMNNMNEESARNMKVGDKIRVQ